MAKLIDSFPSLLIDAALIRACKPLTTKQLAEATYLEEAQVRAIVARRSRGRRATLTKTRQDEVDVFELTKAHYLDVKNRLQPLRLDPATWARAERQYSRPCRHIH